MAVIRISKAAIFKKSKILCGKKMKILAATQKQKDDKMSEVTLYAFGRYKIKAKSKKIIDR